MTTQGRKISDEDLVEIAGGFEQPINTIDVDQDDRPVTGGGVVGRRPSGGSTIPIEPVGGGAAGSSSDLA